MTVFQKTTIGILIAAIIAAALLLLKVDGVNTLTAIENPAENNESIGADETVLIENIDAKKKEDGKIEFEDSAFFPAYPEIKPPGGGFVVKYDSNTVWRSEMARWNEDMLVSIKTGVVVVPKSRVASDSAEAVEYVRIARATIRGLLEKAHEPTVDIFPTSAIVAFRIKRPPPPEGYLRAGRTNRYVVIDVETKSVISVGAW